jgi:hypothetical protein
MDPEGRFDAESALQALLLWPEVGARLLHGDHLGSIDFVGVSVGDDGRRTFAEGVLHPICAIAIRERDQEAFAVLDRDDGRVEGPTRSASDVTNDRGVRSALSGRSEREGPRGEQRQHRRRLHAHTLQSPKGLLFVQATTNGALEARE